MVNRSPHSSAVTFDAYARSPQESGGVGEQVPASLAALVVVTLFNTVGLKSGILPYYKHYRIGFDFHVEIVDRADTQAP